MAKVAGLMIQSFAQWNQRHQSTSKQTTLQFADHRHTGPYSMHPIQTCKDCRYLLVQKVLKKHSCAERKIRFSPSKVCWLRTLGQTLHSGNKGLIEHRQIVALLLWRDCICYSFAQRQPFSLNLASLRPRSIFYCWLQ